MGRRLPLVVVVCLLGVLPGCVSDSKVRFPGPAEVAVGVGLSLPPAQAAIGAGQIFYQLAGGKIERREPPPPGPAPTTTSGWVDDCGRDMRGR